MSIAFDDENAVRWTVVPHPAPRPEEPGHTTLVFTSERGERRTCEGCLPEGGTWDDVDQRVWCALLRHAEVTPATVDGLIARRLTSDMMRPGTPDAVLGVHCPACLRPFRATTHLDEQPPRI